MILWGPGNGVGVKGVVVVWWAEGVKLHAGVAVPNDGDGQRFGEAGGPVLVSSHLDHVSHGGDVAH